MGRVYFLELGKQDRDERKGTRYGPGILCLNWASTIDRKVDDSDRVSMPTKIVATFNVEHPMLWITYGPK